MANRPGSFCPTLALTRGLCRALVVAVLGFSAAAQQTVLLPSTALPGQATGIVDPNSWGNGLGGVGSGLRAMACFSRDNLLARGVTSVVTIQRLRFRARGPGNAVTVPNVTVELSTSASPANGLQPQFDQNHGADRTIVFQGAVQVQAVASTSPVGPFHVDLQFSQPFRFDPFVGDLLLDLQLSSAGISGSGAAPNEIVFGSTGIGSGIFGSLGSQFASSGFPAVPVIEIEYTVPANAASVATYGIGCPDRRAACFEAFTPGVRPFDLVGGSNRVRFTRVADGYSVDTGAAPIVTAPSTPLWLGDDECSSAIPLPFPFPMVWNGVAVQVADIAVSSNGFLWFDGFESEPGASPSAQLLCMQGPRLAALWADLDPASGGDVSYAVIAGGSALLVTWDAVPNKVGGGTVTVQVELRDNGDFELRFGSVTVNQPAIVGFGPGFSLSTVSRDLSAATALPALFDALPLQLAAVGRPVLGSTFAPEIRHVPNAPAIGLMIYSTSQLALDLGVIGADGCSLWVGLDVLYAVFPLFNGASSGIAVPNNVNLLGVEVTAQAAALVGGFNSFGAITSNALQAVVGNN